MNSQEICNVINQCHDPKEAAQRISDQVRRVDREADVAPDNERLGWCVCASPLLSLRLFTTARRTTAQLWWCRSAPGESTRTWIPVSPSAEVLCPADVGPSRPTGGPDWRVQYNQRAVPLGKRAWSPKVITFVRVCWSLYIYHLFSGGEGAANSWCAFNVEHLYKQRFAH